MKHEYSGSADSTLLQQVRSFLYRSKRAWRVHHNSMLEQPMVAQVIVGRRGRMRLIEYIGNGMPTWAYVLIGIALYEIAKRLIWGVRKNDESKGCTGMV